jgi:hypothetical protein
MTLTVTAEHLVNRSWRILKLPEIGGTPTLAGFESTRYTFYGSEESKSLGLTILPTLAHTDIYAEGLDQLNALEAEVRILFDKFGPSESYWHFRLGNILRAIEAAKQYGELGRVVID